MNSSFPFDNYGFMPATQQSKMDYYDSQIYPTGKK